MTQAFVSWSGTLNAGNKRDVIDTETVKGTAEYIDLTSKSYDEITSNLENSSGISTQT